jgi:hypothetical protein
MKNTQKYPKENIQDSEHSENLKSRITNIFLVLKLRIRWAGNVARILEGRGVYRVLVGKLEESRPVGRPRRRWKDSTRKDHRVVGCGE